METNFTFVVPSVSEDGIEEKQPVELDPYLI